MRAPIKDLMDNLGVGYILSAYETAPFAAYDDEEGLTCSAEVRMNSDADEMEAEIQFMYDEPTADHKAIDQIFWLLAKPATGEKWDVKLVKIKSENKAEEVFNWETKSVEFFELCIQDLKLDKIPDIDAIYEKTINKKDRFSGNSQGGGGKSPKIKPAQVLGMKGKGGM